MIYILSLNEKLVLFHHFLLFLRQRPEKLYLLLVRWVPLIIHLECALQMLLHLHVKRLWLYVHERWIVDSWNGLSGDQVMQVASQLRELSAGRLLLAFLLFKHYLPLIVIKLLAHFFILVLNVIQISLSCIEIVLVLSAVVAAIAKMIIRITDNTISRQFWPFHDKTPSACLHSAVRFF